MGADEIRAFLSHLAVNERVSASTQNQALCALVFLYRRVLGVDLASLEGIERAKAPKRLPVVLTRGEVKSLLQKMSGVPQLVCRILYGAGLRLVECLSLRVKDLDFERNELTIRDGKGAKDRVSVLPSSCRDDLLGHLERLRQLHKEDLGGRSRGPDEMTPADPGRRTRSFLFFRRTGQMWKWNSWLGVLYAGGVLMVVGKWRVETDVGILMLMGGSLLGLAAMAWSALSIRCPQCGARPWWMAMNGKCKGLAGLSRC